MERVKINEDLSILVSDLTQVEQNKLMLMATIYERKVEELKKEKINKLNTYLQEQLKFYRCNLKDYEVTFEKFCESYTNKIDRLYDQFCIMYKYLQNEVVFAQTNQKIAVANFVTSKKGLDKARADNNIVLIEKSNKKIMATAQKKLNYDVIIDECIARLEKCINDTLEAIDTIFYISNDKVSIVQDSFFDKIKKFFKLRFNKSQNFDKMIIKPLENDFVKIEDMTAGKISEVKNIMLISIAQFEKIRRDINLSFNETLNKVS